MPQHPMLEPMVALRVAEFAHMPECATISSNCRRRSIAGIKRGWRCGLYQDPRRLASSTLCREGLLCPAFGSG